MPQRVEDVGPYVCELLGGTDDASGVVPPSIAAFVAAPILADMGSPALDTRENPPPQLEATLVALRDVLATGTSPYTLLHAYELLLQLGERNLNVYRWLLYTTIPTPTCLLPGAIQRWVHTIWAGSYASKNQTAPRAPALPLPGASSAQANDTAYSPIALAIPLQQKALAILYEVFCTVRLRTAELRT